MVGSNGLRCRDSVFAFVGRDGNLIAKLPAAHAPLVAEGKATAILAGRQTTREWVGIPSPATVAAAGRNVGTSLRRRIDT